MLLLLLLRILIHHPRLSPFLWLPRNLLNLDRSSSTTIRQKSLVLAKRGFLFLLSEVAGGAAARAETVGARVSREIVFATDFRAAEHLEDPAAAEAGDAGVCETLVVCLLVVQFLKIGKGKG